MEIFLLAIFSALLLTCVSAGLPLLLALLLGYLLFFFYGLRRGFSAAKIASFSLHGVRQVKMILIMFVFIGLLTASWRASGSIALIVTAAAPFCAPEAIVPASFCLCSLMSFLTGTSFGSAATLGSICFTLAQGMGVPAELIGGAVLAGVFFGDRLSPISTSAMLVAALTHTDLYQNIRLMFRDSVLPFLLACALFYLLGTAGEGEVDAAAFSLLRESYTLSYWALAPVLAVLILAFLRANVILTLMVSAVLAFGVALCFEGVTLGELPGLALFGFHPEEERLAALMGGGGISSMASVFGIVAISSSYAGIFSGTNFLEPLEKKIKGADSPFFLPLISIITSAIACNQTLAIMLVSQLSAKSPLTKYELALAMENNVVLIAALIPWSIAGAVPLATIGAPLASMPLAFYIWLVPLCALLKALLKRK